MARAHAPLFLVAAGLLAAGCGGGRFTATPGGATATDYSPTDRIRVMLPAPDKADETGSRVVSGRVVLALQQTHGDVALIPTTNDTEALDAARAAKATYLITPTIVEWTDTHAPPLTADRITVRLDLRDPNTGEVLSTVTFENTSPLLSAVDTRPDALLDESFNRAVLVLIATGSPAARDQQKLPRQ